MAKSKDERANLAQVAARKKAFEAGGGRRGMDKAQRREVVKENFISTQGSRGKEGRQYFVTGEDGKRTLQNVGEGSDPWNVKSLDDFDSAAYGIGAGEGVNRISIAELKGLEKDGGFGLQDIRDHATENDIQISGYAKKYLDKKLGEVTAPPSDGGDQNNPGVPDEDQNPEVGIPTPVDQTPGDYQPAPTRPIVPGMPGSGVSVGGDLTQNIGKTGDMNTTIGDGNTFGAGANIGNDYSLTLGSQNVGGGSANSNAAGLLHQQAKSKAKAFMS